MKEGTFTFKLRDEREVKLAARYECTMQCEEYDVDGDKVIGKPKPHESINSRLTAYVDGKEVDSCKYAESWKLYVDNNGIHKIYGIRIGFVDTNTAKEYADWINEIIEGGKSEEVKMYEKAVTEKDIQDRVEKARETIRKAESQKDIPDINEVRKRRQQWNEVINENAGGYIPDIISKQEYDAAKRIIEEYGK